MASPPDRGCAKHPDPERQRRELSRDVLAIFQGLLALVVRSFANDGRLKSESRRVGGGNAMPRMFGGLALVRVLEAVSQCPLQCDATLRMGCVIARRNASRGVRINCAGQSFRGSRRRFTAASIPSRVARVSATSVHSSSIHARRLRRGPSVPPRCWPPAASSERDASLSGRPWWPDNAKTH